MEGLKFYPVVALELNPFRTFKRKTKLLAYHEPHLVPLSIT